MNQVQSILILIRCSITISITLLVLVYLHFPKFLWW